MSLSYTFLIKSSPDQGPLHWHAQRMIERLISTGHKVQQVFFYGDSVLVANRFRQTPQDEFDFQSGWSQLQEKHGLQLKVCVATANRRGILGEQDKARFKLDSDSCHPAFEIVGLGDFVMASTQSERVISL